MFCVKYFVWAFVGSLSWIDVDAYPSGAPESACISLTPVHKANLPQKTQTPYTVTATKNGNTVTVTISSPYEEDFQGFVMQARAASNKSRLVEGTFSTTPDVSRTLDCLNGRQNTLTQTSKDVKSVIISEWTPGPGINEQVIFRATVAQTFQYFWTEIDSAPVMIGSANGQKQNQNENSDNMYDNCFVNKGCFGLPSGCVARKNCDVLLSYVDSNGGVSFTLQSSLGDNKYMATGISTDRSMGDDSVTECFRDNNRIAVQHSWNERRSNTPLTLVPEGRYEWRIRNGISSCTWNRPYVTEVGGKSFNLVNSTYHILLAKGAMNNGRVTHHDNRIASEESVNFTAYERVSGAGAHDAVKVHGTFMVTGWIAFVSVAILMARYFKNVWEDKMVCGVKLWFAVHRGFMIIALLFIIIAFTVIFVHKGGWTSDTSNPHAVLGCIATGLGVFQPIMAAFRPSPDHPKRPVFNWLHWGVGNVAHIFAIVTIFFAVSLAASGLEDSFYWVMGVFVIVHYCFHLILQLHAYSSEKKKNNEIKMQDMGSGGRYNSGHGDHNKSLPVNVFRVLMLGIYGIFLTIIMLALYSLIGTAGK